MALLSPVSSLRRHLQLFAAHLHRDLSIRPVAGGTLIDCPRDCVLRPPLASNPPPPPSDACE